MPAKKTISTACIFGRLTAVAFLATVMAWLLLWPGLVLARSPAPRPDLPRTGVPETHPPLRLAAAGDPLPRIQCSGGFSATIYAQGLASPDGLAFSPDGTLYVAEETAGRVSRLAAGAATPVLTGLSNPEGIAFDPYGTLYVVEDIQNGRLVTQSVTGATGALATGLDAPEGVVWMSNGTLYLTESNVQFTADPANFRSRVAAVAPTGITTRILTSTVFWSYAGIASAADGMLYVTNEAAGVGTNHAVFKVDPQTGARTLFAADLLSVEGLRFSANGQFPLYVVEEDTGGGAGRLSRVEANGSHSPFCTGFFSIEDVVLDAAGRLFVSEDTTGLVIKLAAPVSGSGAARSLILFIGDGMGNVQRTAGRWYAAGQTGQLAMDALPVYGLSSTASADNPVTDSAAAGTAMATGVKTNNRVIGLGPDGAVLTNILDRARARGKALGLVSTTQMAHATPAAFVAHVPSRYMMTDIAAQMVAAEVDVLLAGGEDEFLPSTHNGCYPGAGERSDGRNLVAEAQAKGYTYVCTAAGLNGVNPASTSRLLGLFAAEGLPRPFSPTLAAMTQKAIDVLSQDPDGFFLMVEGGQIDWAGHANNAANAISDTVGLDEAVSVAVSYAAANGDVLVVVAGDHETGGMSLSLTATGQPGEDGPFFMPDATPFYVNWLTTSHTAVDIPVTALGPCAGLLAGSYANTHIHDALAAALDACMSTYLPLVVREN